MKFDGDLDVLFDHPVDGKPGMQHATLLAVVRRLNEVVSKARHSVVCGGKK